MKRLMMSAALACGVIAGVAAWSGETRLMAAAARPEAAAQQPATKEGWWIRVNPTNKAPNLYWRFGGASNRLSAPVRWVRAQNPEEVDLPADQRGLPVLHVAAIALPSKDPVSFCLFFRDRGVQSFEFTNEKNAEVSQDGQDPACVP